MKENKSSKITTTVAENKVDNGRRGFIKKAGYTAPAVVALGLLGSLKVHMHSLDLRLA